MLGLYLLDIHVIQLMLNEDVYYDTGGSQLVVKVVFINFPPTEVSERGRFMKDDLIHVYKFDNGQSFHFSMTDEELVKKMKKLKLHIGVFRVNDSFPVCSIDTYLSGCACDMGTVCIEKPKPFVFRGPFELLDPGKNFAGQLELDITLSNLGRDVITPYVLAPDCFVFKNGRDGLEYKCNVKERMGFFGAASRPFDSNLANAENMIKDHLLDFKPAENMIRNVAGISPSAYRLALGSPPYKPPRPPLVDPTVKKGKKGKKGKGKKKKKKKK